MRPLNSDDTEVKEKIKELQLFVADKLNNGSLSNIERGQLLVNDIQLLRHIWIKDEGTI